MKDHLDFILNTTYKHNEESFPEECDTLFQPLTVGDIPMPSRNVNYQKGKLALVAAAAEVIIFHCIINRNKFKIIFFKCILVSQTSLFAKKAFGGFAEINC